MCYLTHLKKFIRGTGTTSRSGFGWPNYWALISWIMVKTAQAFYGRLRTSGAIDHMSADWLRPFPTDWQPIKVRVENPHYANLNTVKMYWMTSVSSNLECVEITSELWRWLHFRNIYQLLDVFSTRKNWITSLQIQYRWYYGNMSNVYPKGLVIWIIISYKKNCLKLE